MHRVVGIFPHSPAVSSLAQSMKAGGLDDDQADVVTALFSRAGASRVVAY